MNNGKLGGYRRRLAVKRFAVIGLFVAALVIAQVSTEQGRVQEQYTLAVDVDLVVFNVAVLDSHGHPIPGLKTADFQVYEDNKPQDITLFSAEDSPASIGLIIDNSGSMLPKSADVTKAALAFASSSNPQDEMFVVKFNEKTSFGLPPSVAFTGDLNQIRAALFRNTPSGLTALYDALAAGIEHLKTGSRERKALVVLSDGGDNASHLTLDQVLELAQRSSATIYTIGIYDETDRDRNPSVLRKIAAQSGGRSYFPDSLKDLEPAWRDIAGGIRSQYTIGYHSSNPSHDGKFRKVKITVARSGGKDLRVITRDGYLAPVR